MEMVLITSCNDKLSDIECTRAVKIHHLPPPACPLQVELMTVSSEAVNEKIYGEMTLDSAEGLGEEPQRRQRAGGWRSK